MLINLCKTWAQLAPDEFEIHFQGGHGILLKADSEMHEIRIAMRKDRTIPFEMSVFDQLKLERYLRQCIEARGWSWYLSTDFASTDRNYYATVHPSSLWQKDQSLALYNKTSARALMQAYLACLAAQRPIAAGQWQHFKGDHMAVAGSFPFGTWDIENDDFTVEGQYYFEESPEEWADLLCWGDGHMEFQCIKLSQVHNPDRVAYEHDGKKWARKASDFLSLVGAEHPEDEGKLRFLASSTGIPTL